MTINRCQNLDDPRLRNALPPSIEEQGLTDTYRTKGIDAVLKELKVR